MSSPIVSVVIPAYNAERHIGDALASIQAQTLKDVEVLVIDDGSSDGTVREAERFAAVLDLTVVRQPNAGPSAARNRGILMAQGRYCAFLDADDVMLPPLLESQVAVLERDPEVGLVLTDVSTFNDSGVIHRARWGFSRPWPGRALERLLEENFVTTSAVMAPTRCLIEAGLFPENRRVAEDYELWLRIAGKWKFHFIAEPLVRYRYTNGSLSSDKLFSARSALEVIEAYWRDNPARDATARAIYNRSLARHLANAGSAALREGKRGVAVSYLLKSLRHNPRRVASWKRLIKTCVPAAS